MEGKKKKKKGPLTCIFIENLERSQFQDRGRGGVPFDKNIRLMNAQNVIDGDLFGAVLEIILVQAGEGIHSVIHNSGLGPLSELGQVPLQGTGAAVTGADGVSVFSPDYFKEEGARINWR